jgi:flagellar basal-body rod protein FlgF/flagellar basal-body rod protein FlgG
MDSGYYAACTALVSRAQSLDTIANNLANASTIGYRSEKNLFSSILADAGSTNGTALNKAINSFGILSGTSLDLTQGALQKTGNDMDVAIQGSAFFVVQTEDGPMYTRNGSFQVSGKGLLVTANGDPVMGERGEIPIVHGHISISEDGTISSNGAIAGKLKLVDFPPGTHLASAGNNYYSAPPDTETDATDSTVNQGVLEASNVNAVTCMAELVNAQRTAEMMQKAMSMFNSEIDKTATQDLPKVG